MHAWDINMNNCEMVYCISYALGQPRTVGVSACHVFGGLAYNWLSEYVHKQMKI